MHIFSLILIGWARQALRYLDNHDLDPIWRVVLDVLNEYIVFSLIEEVCDLVERGHVYYKALWETLVFGRAWYLEDEFWCIAIRLPKNLELLARVAQ